MPSDTKYTGPKNLLDLTTADTPTFSLAAPVSASADISLSAAFRHVLGQKSRESLLQNAGLKIGHDIAKRAKAERAGASPSAPVRRNQIGPRSGHK